MTYTAQSLLDGVLNVSASGLIDPSLKLTDVSATATDSGTIRVEGTASKDAVTINVGFDVADVNHLLGLVAASLNDDAPATAKAKAKPAAKVAAPAAVAEAAPVADEPDDAGDAF